MKNLTILLPTLCLFLAGCSETVIRANTSQIHSLPSNLETKSFFVLPASNQQRSLEYDLYAADVSMNLTQSGMREANNFEEADYIVFLTYGVDGGRQVTSSEPQFGWSGGQTTTFSGTARPTFGGLGSATQFEGTATTQKEFGIVGYSNVSKTIYRRIFDIGIVDRVENLDREPSDPLTYAYQGRVVTEGSSDSFLTLSKCMIDALLGDFPGTSGSTDSKIVIAANCQR